MKKFNEQLKKMRETYGYTQQQMANKLEISQPSYIRYEKGTAEPTLDNLIKIADIFEVSVDFLLGRSEI